MYFFSHSMLILSNCEASPCDPHDVVSGSLYFLFPYQTNSRSSIGISLRFSLTGFSMKMGQTMLSVSRISNKTFCVIKSCQCQKFLHDLRVRPNIASDIQISQTTILRQKDPHPSKCIDRFPDKYSNIEKFYNYSQSQCRIACTGALIEQNCCCLDQGFAIPKVSSLARRVSSQKKLAIVSLV